MHVQDDLELLMGYQENLSQRQSLLRVVAEVASQHPMPVVSRRPRLVDEVTRHLPDVSGRASESSG
ncbi:hypothetical protein [Streptomyces albidoflavus]|nr:hypothetical protein [Streptomyces albidoflavus]WQG70521.1 hypothetical protein SR864_04800 [Streptomyces albidoflavus]